MSPFYITWEFIVIDNELQSAKQEYYLKNYRIIINSLIMVKLTFP